MSKKGKGFGTFFLSFFITFLIAEKTRKKVGDTNYIAFIGLLFLVIITGLVWMCAL